MMKGVKFHSFSLSLRAENEGWLSVTLEVTSSDWTEVSPMIFELYDGPTNLIAIFE